MGEAAAGRGEMTMAYIGPLEIMERLGVQFEVDWDGEVTSLVPSEIDRQAVCSLIADMGIEIKRAMEYRRKEATRVFVGGPLGGQRHDIHSWDKTFAHHVGHANWAAYHIRSDGRAVFRGFATSRKKARELAKTDAPAGKL